MSKSEPRKPHSVEGAVHKGRVLTPFTFLEDISADLRKARHHGGRFAVANQRSTPGRNATTRGPGDEGSVREAA